MMPTADVTPSPLPLPRHTDPGPGEGVRLLVTAHPWAARPIPPRARPAYRANHQASREPITVSANTARPTAQSAAPRTQALKPLRRLA